MENASIDSVQKMDEKKIIKAAQVQIENQSQYSVGLNIFEELSNKYHKELKQQLKSKDTDQILVYFSYRMYPN